MRPIVLLGTLALGLAASPALAGQTVIVTNSDELAAAMTPENAGRTIRVRARQAGDDYLVTQALTVPDGATVVGDGAMVFDGDGLPTGFAPGTRTTLRAAAPFLGEVVTLGNGSEIRGLAIEDLQGRSGNVVAVYSRHSFDAVSADIVECEIVNPNIGLASINGPTGRTVAILSRTIRANLFPPPRPPEFLNPPVTHEGSTIDVRIARSRLINQLNGSGIFLVNFAPGSSLELDVHGNVIGGGLDTNGGVSRPIPVVGSTVSIKSRNNLYRSDNGPQVNPEDPGPAFVGWSLKGGSGPPVSAIRVLSTHDNADTMDSANDRIEGFLVGIYADGGARFFPDPTAGPTSNNTLTLDLTNLRLSTLFVDFWLFGAESYGLFTPGTGNKLYVRARGLVGSGARDNFYSNSVGPGTHLPPELAGEGNQLQIEGTPEEFARRNPGIDPMPGPDFFTGH